jgi:hypothetical protein
LAGEQGDWSSHCGGLKSLGVELNATRRFIIKICKSIDKEIERGLV